MVNSLKEPQLAGADLDPQRLDGVAHLEARVAQLFPDAPQCGAGHAPEIGKTYCWRWKYSEEEK